MEHSTVYIAWKRALKRLPEADVEAMRTAQRERLQRMRGKVWTEIAGRAAPSDPSQLVPPSPQPLNDLISTALRIETREAALYGLDAATNQQLLAATATFGQPISHEETRAAVAPKTTFLPSL